MLLDILLLTTVLICCITDLKSRKIYNKILFPALVLGVGINIFNQGWQGLFTSAQGFLLGLGLLLIPFILGRMGAGDVKLLAVIGALKGPYFVFYTFIAMGLAGGLLALGFLLYQGAFWQTLRQLGQGLWVALATRFKVIHFGEGALKQGIPYGVAISIGTLTAYIMG